MRILLTGIAGQLGRRMALRLAQNHEVTGIDRRPCLGLPDTIEVHRADLRRRATLEIMERVRPEAIVHMGVVHNFRIASEQLYSRNVLGCESLLRAAVDFDVKKVVLLSSGDVYGPSPANSHFIDEDAPLMASQRFPEVRTLVAVDRAVQSFFWRHPEIETVILRPAHIVGPHVRNAPSNYLRLRIVPTQMGFDPMLQLIAEDDVLSYVERALLPNVRGVYNITSIEPLPLSFILRLLDKPTLPILHPLFRLGLKQLYRWHLTTFPPPELDHIRFHAVLDTRRAERDLDPIAKRTLMEIIQPFVRMTPAPTP